ncbi:MAG: T9SS type A sorting domain-containing protein [candidate division KSB1 bacterium]|nr:T9SS type A sorting domain-containing protein [candidate division KSB1 bacterium]MDZ7275433.1 T9SS type A sorting domain-containing protein [candidate division KSB1 bacterium]MDZ7286255.1 T9SS type A sorting domain-containing protein [candidate division KSB1 bacterium]MDZ7296481.1 T9SS type A sorting domain-containing protein [candidate division KSB1 bacterium]MDZ7305560.1 T9SS type A sorting domain-containing protein [candidate division KSB1 bacterium]
MSFLVCAAPLFAQPGSPLAVSTTAEFRKSNQSKVFFYDGMWWTLGYHEAQAKWYIWKYDGSVWTRTNKQEASTSYYIDAVLDTVNDKLYTFASHHTKPRFRRYGYAGGLWSKELEKSTLQYFVHPDKSNPVSMVLARNGTLWLFRVDGSSNLQATYSSNMGTTWSPAITIKTGLNVSTGTTDAVAFTLGGQNYVGVGYAEKNAANSAYGFLYHRDGDADTLWTDESSQLTFFGSEVALNDICMAVDGTNQIYMFVRTAGGNSSDPRNTLYRRNTAGVWSKFAVNNVGTGPLWTSPAIAIDGENQVLYLLGRNTTSAIVEYKMCSIGQENTLLTAAVDTLLASGTDAFANISVPAGLLNSTTGLMVVGDNTTDDDLWFNLLPISAASNLIINSVAVSPDTVNYNAGYTIQMTVSAGGALSAGSGQIYLRFPDNTLVPASISPANILINGTPAATASANSATRELAITTPVNIAPSSLVTVEVTAATGLLNPTLAGNYTLEAWTSAQHTPVTSPSYTLFATNTTVTAATVTPFPAEADSAANYTIAFRVGAAGRLLSGTSTFTVQFPLPTVIANGSLTGVTVNAVSATASGNSSNRTVTITVPAAVTINNSDSVTLFIPYTGITNPSHADTFYLHLATSVETTLVQSQGYDIRIGRPISSTTKNIERQNQSKIFHHGGYWWAMLQDKSSKNWYLCQRLDTTWTAVRLITNLSKARPDCILDAPNNRVYILLPGASTTYLTRLTYNPGSQTWTTDSGYPKTVWAVQQANMNLVRANNGALWVFYISGGAIHGRRSSDNGNTWGSAVVIKSGLHDQNGLTDAVPFTYAGNSYVGLGYAEDGSSSAIFGFLRHKDTDPDTIWTDETSNLEQFDGTDADDHINMLVHNNEIFMIVKTAGGTATAAKNGLMHRETDGDWSSYAINIGEGWTRPVGAIDASNGELYVMGTTEGAVQIGEMKHVALGHYNDLVSAPVDTIFQNSSDDFFDLSAAHHTLTSASDLMVLASNITRDATWSQFIALLDGALAKPGIAPEESRQTASGVATGAGTVITAYPNPFNPVTNLRFRLTSPASVRLQIFNLNGQVVRTLVNGDLPAGTHERRWNGRNQLGEPVASGTYFYRLLVDGQAQTGLLHFIK